ncbi:MAG TPA: hypothetical protein VGV15_00865, partial [Terriglobales bacterium]|nr:hypothetical protein [Terriglobales bacterium]
SVNYVPGLNCQLCARLDSYSAAILPLCGWSLEDFAPPSTANSSSHVDTQGLKPAFLAALSGTAEAVPFQNRFMRWLQNIPGDTPPGEPGYF